MIPPDSDSWSLSRLRWLNSTTAVDEEPAKGYTPLKVSGKTISCLGRELELGDDGLPKQIRSYFNKAVTKVMEKPTLELLHGNLEFLVHPERTADVVALKGEGFTFTKQAPGVVEWKANLAGGGTRAFLTGSMEFDGSVHYRVTLEASEQPVSLGRAGLMITRSEASTPCILGLQQESGETPSRMSWKWDTANKNQDSVWLGAVNGGLRVQLRAENYIRPSVNIHYKRRPLNNPPSWNAGDQGTIELYPAPGGDRCLSCMSGPLTLEPAKPLHFDFDLLITPFHTLRTKEQWSERYYHTGGVPADINKYLDSAKSAGANVVNIHQGNALNPYINYPFLTWEKLRDFSKAAHDRGIRTKYYYTVRELSNWCPELFAFRSMGDEILMSGKGGGHPWGEEHLGGNYWQAWYEPGVQDVSFLTQPMSRFHNYYIEGLRWLCENAGCDGIYLDDIAYDRSIMLRARKVLDRYCPRGGLIDLHSWNEFHDGGAWAHCANIFMDSLPFVDRMWFGEGHHYTGPPPEHFLVEISGVPFGLMGEMLEGGGNPWLGLVHGITGRLGWGGNPRGVWKLWDDFGVQDAEFIGWWAGDENPVRPNAAEVKATVWKKNGSTLLALANFSKTAQRNAL
ncbi:MAG TPA: glycoside hydrolase domain-containing protein, partial [Verrucomicrobiales bacterium]|nr:glycoside hydrolase domain-containing protein [Verrucomicrobiales bacterium]